MQNQQDRPSIIFASSSSVYGLNTKQPSSEDDRVDSPASLYAATKRASKAQTLLSPVHAGSHSALTCQNN